VIGNGHGPQDYVPKRSCCARRQITHHQHRKNTHDHQPKHFLELAMVGSVQAIILFLATISFLFTTPGIGEPAGGFPALSLIGEFLLNDVPLLGLSFWTLALSIAQ
jgi:hypothetical protein